MIDAIIEEETRDSLNNIYIFVQKFIPSSLVKTIFFDEMGAIVFSSINEIHKSKLSECIDYDDLVKCMNIENVTKSKKSNFEFFVKYSNKKTSSVECILLIDFFLKNSYKFATLILNTNEYGSNSFESIAEDDLLSEYLYQNMLKIHFSQNIIEKAFSLIGIFSELLASKDTFMPHHMFNVSRIALDFASRLKLTSKQNHVLLMASLLHDVGKLFISDTIINKTSSLDDNEARRIKDHPMLGEKIAEALLVSIPELNEVPLVIRHHHERFDGHGYPDKLLGENIHLLSRILNISDSIDAMRSVRSYKNRKSDDDIIIEILKCSGKQFDPNLVKIAVDILSFEKQKESVYDYDFIPKATLVLYLGDYDLKVTFYGNLFISSHHSKFVVREKINLSDVESTKVIKGKIIYRIKNNYNEYDVKIVRINKNNVILEKFEIINYESHFSLNWENDALLYKSNIIISCRIVKISVNNIVVEIDKASFGGNDAESIELIHNICETRFSLDVDNVIEELSFKISLLNLENLSDGYYANFRFNDQNQKEKDKLFRLLFRKQIQMRRRLNG